MSGTTTAPRRTAPTPSADRPGPLGRLADVAFRHRGRTVLAWVATLMLAVGLTAAFGGEFTADYSAPGSDSLQAQDLLEAEFPAQAGDSIDVVVPSGTGLSDGIASGAGGACPPWWSADRVDDGGEGHGVSPCVGVDAVAGIQRRVGGQRVVVGVDVDPAEASRDGGRDPIQLVEDEAAVLHQGHQVGTTLREELARRERAAQPPVEKDW